MDGFDEIGSSDSNDSSQNKEKIANLIRCLAQYTSVRAVVTTRPDSETYLRNIFPRIYMFKSLQSRERVDYILTYCKKRLRLLKNSNPIQPFFSIPDELKTEAFSNNPLHIAMMSEMFFEMMRNELFKSPLLGNPLKIANPSLETLYSEFINMRYKIYFREKKNSMVDNRTKENCNSAFQKLALFSLYGNEEFTKECFSNDSMFQHDSDGRIALNADKVREYYDIGMITYLSESSIEFIHRTFAEYFVGDLFISWLHDKKLSETSIVAIVTKMSIKYHRSYPPNFLPEGIEYLCRFINLKICLEQFSGDILEAHHRTMASLGVNMTIKALSSYLACGYYNIANHIMKCWIKVGKFHELLLPTKHAVGENVMLSSQKQILSSFFSKEELNGWNGGYFLGCMRCFCVIHEHGVQENPRDWDGYSICLGLLKNGNVEVLESLIQVMVANQLIRSDNKVGKLMHLAVHSGNKNVVEWMEEMGGDIFSKTDRGTSTVLYAIRMRKYEMAEWLQERGVKIRNSANNQGSDVINEACVSVYLSKQLISRLFDLGFIKNRINMEDADGNENSLRLAMDEPWGHEDTLELLLALAKLGSDVRICSEGGVDALHSVAAAGNNSEIMEWLKRQGLDDKHQPDDKKSALHVTLFLDFLFKPAPESLNGSNPLTPDSTDEALCANFLCDGHLNAIPKGNGLIIGWVTQVNIALREAQNSDHHPKFNDKYHDIELDGIHTINSDDVQLIYSKYKNSVLRLINIMATSEEASKIGVLTVCGEVRYR
uniref:Uncharacterized protein n=1 Tax=Lygus hesperus TaxID=30085 RepID=A0A0A9YCJ2_LYGHE